MKVSKDNPKKRASGLKPLQPRRRLFESLPKQLAKNPVTPPMYAIIPKHTAHLLPSTTTRSIPFDQLSQKCELNEALSNPQMIKSKLSTLSPLFV
ncbi:MAG TPA: hypothetical protein VK589_05705 [Chryseolinea sp.]|nr:hypothetical protein [Chryseolinea sp.]